MKNLFTILTLLFILCSTSTNYAGDSSLLGKKHFSTNFSLANSDGVDNNTNIFSIQGNFPIQKNIDISLAGSYSWYEDEILGFDLKANTNTIISNIIYHFSTESILTPYVGAGIGYISIDVEVGSSSDSESRFLYDGLVGIQIEPSNKSFVNLSYTVMVIDGDSSGSISSDLGYWFTDKFALDLGLGYNADNETTNYGISGNFLF